MKLKEWIQRDYPGLDGWWQCLQFDQRVMDWGVWCDNRLNEMKKVGKEWVPKHTLEELLKAKKIPSKVPTLWEVLHGKA